MLEQLPWEGWSLLLWIILKVFFLLSLAYNVYGYTSGLQNKILFSNITTVVKSKLHTKFVLTE